MSLQQRIGRVYRYGQDSPVVEGLHDGLDGPVKVDVEEARRAYEAARLMADERLSRMYRAVVDELGTQEAVMPLAVRDLGLAWVKSR